MAALIQLSFRNNLLQPVRQWLEAIEVHDSKVARLLCKMIPAHCPFERNLEFGYTVLRIPYGSLREVQAKSSLRASDWSALQVFVLSGRRMW